MSATYLVRFDDLCPTMNWGVWDVLEHHLVETGVRPLLAVVPDNQDENLKADAANPRFWDRVRSWEARGWAIGLHGYQHRYVTDEAGIIGLNQRSEFAGLPVPEQKDKLVKAKAIFDREGVTPRVWIAPGHSFDDGTVAALAAVDIDTISDGLFAFPHRDADGVLWVPQQLWSFRPLPLGVWTVCLHPNRWTKARLDGFRRNLDRFGPRISDLETVASRYGTRPRGRLDPVVSTLVQGAVRAKARSSSWRRRALSSSGDEQ